MQPRPCTRGVDRVAVPVLKRDDIVGAAVTASIAAGAPGGNDPDNACHTFAAVFCVVCPTSLSNTRVRPPRLRGS